MSRARAPPNSTVVSRFTCQDTEPGPNSPASLVASIAPTVRGHSSAGGPMAWPALWKDAPGAVRGCRPDRCGPAHHAGRDDTSGATDQCPEAYGSNGPTSIVEGDEGSVQPGASCLWTAAWTVPAVPGSRIVQICGTSDRVHQLTQSTRTRARPPAESVTAGHPGGGVLGPCAHHGCPAICTAASRSP